jgi:hypothetical protein
MKVSFAPLACQEPAVVGVRVGSGELFDKAAENVIVTGALASTPLVPFAGATDMTLSVGAGVVEVVVAGVVEVVVAGTAVVVVDPPVG